MDTYNQHLLVVRAVEDADLTPRRNPGCVAPQEVVVELLRGGDFEAVHDDTLWVDATHHVADRAVLARGVECLQHDQEAVGVLGCESVLVLGEELDPVPEVLLAILFPQPTCLEARVVITFEDHLRLGRDSHRFDQLCELLSASVPGSRQAL